MLLEFCVFRLLRWKFNTIAIFTCRTISNQHNILLLVEKNVYYFSAEITFAAQQVYDFNKITAKNLRMTTRNRFSSVENKPIHWSPTMAQKSGDLNLLLISVDQLIFPIAWILTNAQVHEWIVEEEKTLTDLSGNLFYVSKQIRECTRILWWKQCALWLLPIWWFQRYLISTVTCALT